MPESPAPTISTSTTVSACAIALSIRSGKKLTDIVANCNWLSPEEQCRYMCRILIGAGAMMSSDDEDYVYDEVSGEWISAADARDRLASENAVEVRDSVGNILADGDQVTLIKDLNVKGAGQTLKRGTLIKSIRLTGDAQEIDCRFDGIKGLVLRAEFVRKR
jgi:protein PhnA